MDTRGSQFQLSEGTDVYGSDGDKVGSVVAVQPNYVVVEKGFFFPTDYYIPTSAIASADGDKVYLSVTKDEALNQGWDAEPTGGYAEDLGGTAVAAPMAASYETDVVAAPVTDLDADADLARTDVDMGTRAAASTTRVETGEVISVPVHEETLTATTREREIGEVEIQKDVVQEQRTIDVPVTEERVRVERRVVDRAVDASDDTAFQEGTIEVPIHGEEVQLQKQVRVAEEVEIGKEAVQRTEQVSGTVRREEVRINESDVTTGTTRTSGTTTTGDEGLLDQTVDAVKDTNRQR